MFNLKNKNETFIVDTLYLLAFLIVLIEFFMQVKDLYFASGFTVIACAVILLDKKSSKLIQITAMINIAVIFIVESYQYFDFSDSYRLLFYIIIALKAVSTIFLKKKFGKVI